MLLTSSYENGRKYYRSVNTRAATTHHPAVHINTKKEHSLHIYAKTRLLLLFFGC